MYDVNEIIKLNSLKKTSKYLLNCMSSQWIIKYITNFCLYLQKNKSIIYVYINKIKIHNYKIMIK